MSASGLRRFTHVGAENLFRKADIASVSARF
jgi:hypothetical protein